MTEESRKLYEAVKKWKWSAIKKFVKSGGDINASLVLTGPGAGFTALHFAVIGNKRKHVEKLIKTYNADVNSVAEDGATLLQIAYLRRNFDLANILLKNGADINAKFNEQVYEKYNVDDDKTFSDDFGGTMTLIAFAVYNAYEKMTANILIASNPDIRIRDTDDRTLLMRTIREDDLNSAWGLADLMKNNSEELNARDKDGWHAVNHLLSKNETRVIFYYIHDLNNFEERQAALAMVLIDAEVDMNAMVNGDPDTLLVNKAALRRSYVVLSTLLRLDLPFSVKAKPLHCLALPVDPKKHASLFYHFDEPQENIDRRNECIKCILDYYTLRRAFGFFVPEEEIKLMDQMVAADSNYKKMVANFEKEFINGVLKNLQIFYGKKCITFYDVAVTIFNARNLKLLVEDNEFVGAFRKFNTENRIVLRVYRKYKLYKVILDKIASTHERKKLMEEIQKIPNLTVFIPLPYELILEITDYFSNKDLQEFVQAFQ